MGDIATSGLPKIGNMTSGGGLAAAIDPGPGTGYRTENYGWAGVSFPAPQRIARVRLTPPTNGFDVSGLLSTIVLRLYGKRGAAPTGGSDGVKLAECAFTDVNASVERVLDSADQLTRWDHVWVSVYSGVWAALQGVVIECASPVFLPQPAPGRITVYEHGINLPIALPWVTAEVVQTRFPPLFLTAPIKGFVDFSCDFKHVAVAGYEGPIGIGWTLGFRHGVTLDEMLEAPWQALPRMTGSTQIASLDHHYASSARPGTVDLLPGYTMFSFAGSAHTTASTENGHAVMQVEGGRGFNVARLILSDLIDVHKTQ